MHDNERLVRQILDGNELAFERLIRNFQRLVSHIVFRMIDNVSDREDICQDVFVKVYKNLKGFRFDSKLSTWIARIAYNRCINFLEKKKVVLYDDLTDDEYYWYSGLSSSYVSRSLYIDNVLYTISDIMVKMNSLNDLSEINIVKLE